MSKQEKNKEVVKWEEAVTSLTDYFAKRYFGKDPEVWWVADQIGGVLFINDYFFNVNDIVDFVCYKYTSTQMFNYYEYALKVAEMGAGPAICIRDYKKLKISLK